MCRFLPSRYGDTDPNVVEIFDLGEEPWNLDVLLACVYCVYLYTITRLRMTQEFNKVIPPLPELVRRILGVHRLESLEA